MDETKTGGKAKDAGDNQGRKLLNNGVDPNVGADYRFKPGQSGNPAGRKKGHKNLSTQSRELMDDPRFIDKLSEKVKDKVELPDEEFQGTPMKAIITTAINEAIDPNVHPKARGNAREWLGKFGYGTKIDITSDDEKLVVAPLVISQIKPRQGAEVGDASTQTEAS